MFDNQNFNGIETVRLFLREITPVVIKFIFENFSDIELMDFFSFTTPEELIQQKEKYTLGMTTFNRSFFYYHLIEKISAKNIGWCGFHTLYTQHDRAEIGYEINSPEFRNRGLMSEAIKPIIQYGFEVLNLNRIEAFVGGNNISSLTLMQRNGFTQEGILRSHYFLNNFYEDSLVFSLIRNEYYKT